MVTVERRATRPARTALLQPLPALLPRIPPSSCGGRSSARTPSCAGAGSWRVEPELGPTGSAARWNQLEAFDGHDPSCAQENPHLAAVLSAEEPDAAAVEALVQWHEAGEGLGIAEFDEDFEPLPLLEPGKAALAAAEPAPDSPPVVATLHLAQDLRRCNTFVSLMSGIALAERCVEWVDTHGLGPSEAFQTYRPMPAEVIGATALEARYWAQLPADQWASSVDDIRDGARDLDDIPRAAWKFARSEKGQRVHEACWLPCQLAGEVGDPEARPTPELDDGGAGPDLRDGPPCQGGVGASSERGRVAEGREARSQDLLVGRGTDVGRGEAGRPPGIRRAVAGQDLGVPQLEPVDGTGSHEVGEAAAAPEGRVLGQAVLGRLLDGEAAPARRRGTTCPRARGCTRPPRGGGRRRSRR